MSNSTGGKLSLDKVSDLIAELETEFVQVAALPEASTALLSQILGGGDSPTAACCDTF